MRIFICILLLFFVGLMACKKSEDRSCWKFNGDAVVEKKMVGSFNTIEINPNMIVNLVQDTVNYCLVSGGKNVINAIKTNIDGEKLSLKNENKCDFLRNPKRKISVEVHFVDLSKIIFQGSESLTCSGTISVNNLEMQIKETSATIDLQVNTLNLRITAEPSFGNFIIAGFSRVAAFGVKGNAYCDTRNLVVQDKLLINSRTASDCFVNGATAHLKCETNSLGNVYYTNTPAFIEWNDYASGKLLPAP